ncbi:MAG: thermonuclease family protein [Methylohalobius sp. ZOD2]
MGGVQIFWDPGGFELDSLGRNKLTRITDGDTPFVELSIRMLSIDTPEVHYPGNANPARHDENLRQLADWLQAGKAPVEDDLAAYLHPKLKTGEAGTLQRQQGEAATRAFQTLLEQNLAKPNGRKRSLFLRAADEPFDRYGRLLAYIAPSYSTEERLQMTLLERATFNLLLVAEGWAAPFLIYPSLPQYHDLVLFCQVARTAHEENRGIWSDPNTLAGYEFRMAYKLWKVTRDLERGRRLGSSERNAWIDRYCADLTTREVFEPQRYHRIPPYHRLFLWPFDIKEAVGRLNLLPGLD